jgi:starch synthase
MDILFVSSELAPYVKVGGLADVVAALPKALRQLGHKVTVLLPRFPAFEAAGLSLARRLTPLKFTLGGKAWEMTLFDARLPTQVELVLVDAPGLYDRAGVYGEGGEDFADNATRFAILSRAAAEIVRQRAASGTPFDIVHCQDWPTALVPTYLRELVKERQLPEASVPKTILTIHNLAHQGTFPKDALPSLGLSWDEFRIDGIEFYGGLNVLKLGILTADAVTTVSTTYAREIQTPDLGYKLDGVLRDRARAIVGITNGVDYAVWNPATDSAIPAHYDAEDPVAKARCKGALQKELGLPIDAAAPLIASVGRLVPQKGSDLVAGLIPKLLRATEAQIVVAGDGEPSLVKKLEDGVRKGSVDAHGRAVFVQAASEPLVHRIYAGADIVLVPSRFEPCGLVQLYAQRYGALPVARATGGLVDTVVDCDAKLETGTGFLFEEATVEALLAATERAIAARVSSRWPALVRRVMRLDRGWERPARQYEQVYRSLLAG